MRLAHGIGRCRRALRVRLRMMHVDAPGDPYANALRMAERQRRRAIRRTLVRTADGVLVVADDQPPADRGGRR